MPAAWGGADSADQRDEELQCPARSQGASLVERLGERAPVCVLHRKKAVPLVLPDVEHPHDIRMVQRGLGCGLRLEAIDCVSRIQEPRVQELHRHRALRARIDGEIDRAARASADIAPDLIAIGDRSTSPALCGAVECVCHSGWGLYRPTTDGAEPQRRLIVVSAPNTGFAHSDVRSS